VIYNKAYADSVAGIKHPELMGTGFRGPFAEIWESVSTIFDECRRTGKSVAVEEQMLPINRRGFEEETYYTWSLTPLYGGTPYLLGLFNAPFETTRQTIYDRRTKTLLKLGEEVALAKSVSSFWQKILSSLEDNEWDFPFALVYSVVDDSETDDSGSVSSGSSLSMKSCELQGALGIPEGHPAAPQRIDLKRGRGGFVQTFRDSMQTREPRLLKITDGTLSESMMEGFEWRGFGEPCKLAVALPIRVTTASTGDNENVLGFLVVGINPRRPYDDDYQAFINLLNRQLATSCASVTLFEEEIRRGATAAEAAALERSRLSDELAFQRSRLQRMAELSPVGMFSLSMDGILTDANDRYFDMTGHPRDEVHEMSWVDSLLESSRTIAEEGWAQLKNNFTPWSAELQINKILYDPVSGEEIDNWILAALQPEFDDDGAVKAIMGSITDITFQKRSAKDADTRALLSEQLLLRTRENEALQIQRLKEAEETRRQQNNFIDITSQ
jgi:PAS domain S-box-containing protein